MSSCPGYTLEAFLMWQYDLIVDGDTGANKSLEIAEILGRDTRRRRLTKEQFASLVILFESQRERVENLLCDFDEENQSWRDYAGCAFDMPPEIELQAEILAAHLRGVNP